MSQKSEKYVQCLNRGFALNQRGAFDQKAKDFVLAAHGGEPDWEELAINIALMHELSSQPLRKKGGK